MIYAWKRKKNKRAGSPTKGLLNVHKYSLLEAIELSKMSEKETAYWIVLEESKEPGRVYKNPSLTELLEIFPDKTRFGWLPAEEYHKKVQAKKKEKPVQPVR